MSRQSHRDLSGVRLALLDLWIVEPTLFGSATTILIPSRRAMAVATNSVPTMTIPTIPIPTRTIPTMTIPTMTIPTVPTLMTLLTDGVPGLRTPTAAGAPHPVSMSDDLADPGDGLPNSGSRNHCAMRGSIRAVVVH